MAEPESKPKYAVNPETGQVMRNDGTGWQKVKTAKNEAGDILINEGGQWAPLPGRTSAPAPAGFAQTPKMSIADAAMVAGRQGREWGTADEAAGVRKGMGVPDWAARAYEMVNPMAPFVNMGMGIGGMVGEATGNAPSGYTQGRDEARAELAQARSDRPVTSFVSELAGGAAYPAGALKMGAPILGQSVKLAGIGAAQGAAYGYAASEGDTSDRVESAQVGAAVGGALGGAMPSVAAASLPVFRAGKTGVAEFADFVVGLFGGKGTAAQGNAEQVAKAAIQRSMERSGMTPEKVMEALQKFGDKPAVLAEVIGQDAVNALTSLTRRPGSTPQKAQAIIEERFGGFVDRAQSDLEKATGFNRANIQGEFDAELAARQQAAAPIYQQAFDAFPRIESQRLQQLAASPILKRYMSRAQQGIETEAALAGRAPEEMPQLQFWDLVKRELDDGISTAEANQNLEEVRRLTLLKDQMVDEIDAVTGGVYARAREIGGEAPRLRQAFRQGEQALGGRLAAADIEGQVQSLNPQDQPFFQAGMTSNIATRLDKGMTPQRFRVPDTQGKVRAGLGEDQGNAFLRNMEAEATLRDTGARWAPRMNSVTGTVLESGPSQFGDDLIRAATAAARGDKIGLITQAVNFMRRRGYNQAQIDAMGDLLLSNPQEGLRRLGIQLPQGGPPSGGGAAGGAVGAGFGPSSQMPENAFAQTMSNQQTVPSQNAFSRNEAGSVSPEVVMGMFSGTGGSMAGAAGGGYYGSTNDLNGDGVIDEKDVERGVLVGGAAGFGVGVSPFAAREIMSRTKSAVPEFANDALPMRRNLITAPDNMEDVQDYMTLLRGNDDFAEVAKILGLNFDAGAVGRRGEMGNRVRAIIDRERAQALELLYKKYHEIKRASRPAVPDGADAVAAPQLEPPSADVIPFRPNDPKQQGIGNAFAQSLMGGAGGSAYGSQNDINGDGVIDEQDVFLGSAAGTVGVPLAGRIMRGGGENAFAPQARSMGVGGGGRKPPPDSPEAITEGVRQITDRLRATAAPQQPGQIIAPRGNMRGAIQPPPRVPPASPMAGQVPPPLPMAPPRPGRIPRKGLSPTEIALVAGTAGVPIAFGVTIADRLRQKHSAQGN